MVTLGHIAEKIEGAGRITREDEQLLALAQGWAHGATHSLFFYYRSFPLKCNSSEPAMWQLMNCTL